jgi:hypothetical protein
MIRTVQLSMGSLNYHIGIIIIKFTTGSSVSTVSGYRPDIRVIRGSISGRGKRVFPLASVSRLALGPTHTSVQWVPGVLYPGLKRCRGVTLTIHPHLVPRSRMSRSYIFSSLKHLHGLQWDSFFFMKVFFLLCPPQ